MIARGDAFDKDKNPIECINHICLKKCCDPNKIFNFEQRICIDISDYEKPSQNIPIIENLNSTILENDLDCNTI